MALVRQNKPALQATPVLKFRFSFRANHSQNSSFRFSVKELIWTRSHSGKLLDFFFVFDKFCFIILNNNPLYLTCSHVPFIRLPLSGNFKFCTLDSCMFKATTQSVYLVFLRRSNIFFEYYSVITELLRKEPSLHQLNTAEIRFIFRIWLAFVVFLICNFHLSFAALYCFVACIGNYLLSCF